MKKFVVVGMVVLVFATAGCNTTPPLVMPELVQPKEGKKLESGESKVTLALAKLVSDIPRGDPIFSFPASPPTEGQLCNHSFKGGDATITYGGGREYLGNWSSELGRTFHQIMSNKGYNMAGDPSDLFDASKAAASAEYLIAGRLTKMSGNFCNEHDLWYGRPMRTFSGEMHVEVEWSVLNTLTKETVLKKRIGGYYKQLKPINGGVYTTFENAFSDSLERLAAFDEMLNLARGEVSTTPINTKKLEKRLTLKNGKEKTDIALDRLTKKVVTVRVGTGHGSGFFVGDEGYVMTNAHVVGSANSVQIKTSDGIELLATVEAVDRVRDVALLKSPIRIPDPIRIKTELPSVAQDVFVIGSPMDESLSNTVTKGIVSAIRQPDGNGLRFIQADAAISPGNSGGPLVDSKGNVIGISVRKVVAKGAESLGMFIPVDDAFYALGVMVK